jgi:LmbE family N-acetylglucosaminyl deacetylase
MIDSLASFGRTLVIAPHPDDEVLGAGGTMSRLADQGSEVFVAVVTVGKPPAYSAESVRQVQAEAREAHGRLGVSETFWLDQPAAELTETPNRTLNAAIFDIVRKLAPTTLLVPFVGDIHVDHQLVFRAALVASRPHQAEYPGLILAYETLSETNWNAPYLTPGFLPNVFVDISGQLDRKLEAMRLFGSQLREAPHERSVEALRALATLRGATIHRPAAEGFVLVRQAIR